MRGKLRLFCAITAADEKLKCMKIWRVEKVMKLWELLKAKWLCSWMTSTTSSLSSAASLRSSVSAAFFGASAGVATKLTFDSERLGYACAQLLAEEHCSIPEVGLRTKFEAGYNVSRSNRYHKALVDPWLMPANCQGGKILPPTTRLLTVTPSEKGALLCHCKETYLDMNFWLRHQEWLNVSSSSSSWYSKGSWDVCFLWHQLYVLIAICRWG